MACTSVIRLLHLSFNYSGSTGPIILFFFNHLKLDVKETCELNTN